MKNVSAWLRGLVLMMFVAVACSSPETPDAPTEKLGKTASALTARYQAEAMSWSGTPNVDGEIITNPQPAHRYIWSDSFISQTHTFAGGSTTIKVRAMGELMNGVGPHIVVTVGATQVGDAYVNETSWTDKTFTFSASAGAQEIRVTFDNDDQSATEDRNLLVDWVEVDDPVSAPSCTDTTYEAEAMSWTGTPGSDGEVSSDPAPAHLYMWTDGSITQAHTFTAAAMRIRVRAAGELLDNVGPHIVVKVNGTEIGSAHVNETTWVDKTFDFTATEGSQEIRVTYDNDDWADPQDRNLLLDKIEVLCGASQDAGTTDASADASSCTPETCTSTSACSVAQCTANGCEHTPAAAGTSCSDGDACNGAETCDGNGTCQPGTAPACTSSSPCMVAQCDPASGCTQVPAPAGTSCADANACNGAETCDGAGNCVGGAPLACDSGTPCVVDSCDPIAGCVHAPASVGTSCSDGDACNGSETCDGNGACAPGTPLALDDGNPCTTDTCDPAGGVTHAPSPVGTSCADADACNGAETCDGAGRCAPGAPPAIDDGDVCTIDECRPELGVVHTAVTPCIPKGADGPAPFEPRASIVGRVVSKSGAPLTTASFMVFDGHLAGVPRSDVAATVASDGSFRIRLTAFPEAEPDRSPPHRLVLVIDSPSTIRATRLAFAHPGDVADVGTVKLVTRDPLVTNIGPEGGVAHDSQGLLEVVVPPGALSTVVPIQLTPLESRNEFPSPLPDSTITMYGASLDPSGTTFAVPATLRVANYRGFPTSLEIPVGTFNPVTGHWDHDAVAHWDGTHFAAPIHHFSEVDCNSGLAGDQVLIVKTTPNANRGTSRCGMGSSWRVTGGALEQTFALPTTHVRGDDFGLSLHYDSGLAGSRKLGTAPSSLAAVPRGAFAVSAGGISVSSACVPRGASQAASGQPGQCAAVGGTCGPGAGTTLDGMVSLLGAQFRQLQQYAQDIREASFGGWIDVPVEGQDPPSTGYATQNVRLAGGALGTCAGNAGTFGVSDPMAPRVQLSQPDDTPWMEIQRKVLVHHRFNSPYGAGWALRDVSHAYVAGDIATVLDGTGDEEPFGPRATVTPVPDASSSVIEHALARDPITGELFDASSPGTISTMNPTTGALTPILSGLDFAGEPLHSLAIAYVGSARHFVLARASALIDIDAAGATRQLATRPPMFGGNTYANQASVAARGDLVFYTDGRADQPIIERARLSDASPALTAVSAATGDVRLHPTSPLAGVQFAAPRGLAFAPDGALYVADPRRHMLYRIAPQPNGEIGPSSVVKVAAGRGAGRYITALGERYPAEVFSLNQPSRLSVAEDGTVLIVTPSGIASYDPLAHEAEMLLLDEGRDEILVGLAGMSGGTLPSRPASIVALSRSSLFARTSNDGLVRVDVKLLSSERDPTRSLERLPTGELELVDTTRATVTKFDLAGRMVEQRNRTGEVNFTVEYADAKSERIDRFIDPVGGATTLGYTDGKLSSITDSRGRTTQITIDGSGDLTRFVMPDGEAHAFAYDAHHMTQKTSPKGDVTAYTYAPDGTIATSAKPGGENYSFQASLSQPAVHDASGRLERSGSFTDAHGVEHTFRTNLFGDLEQETYEADGVTRVEKLVYASSPLSGPEEPFAARRTNKMLRATHRTLNDIPLSGPLSFDSLGRPIAQRRNGAVIGSVDVHKWKYSADGWLDEVFDAPSAAVQRYERDAVGHVTRVFDVISGAATGRELSATWRADGQPATVTSHGVTTTFTYDDAGTKNLFETNDTLGRHTSFTYDAYGNVASTSDTTASTSFVHDANNRLTEIADALGNATVLRYAQTGCGCSEEDQVAGIHTPDLPVDVEWLMTYGPQGRLATVTDPYGFTETYSYEPSGELHSVRDRLDRLTTIDHDQLGRVLGVLDQAGRKQRRGYPAPSGGAWSGPSVTAASADATDAATSLSDALRSGDYQIGANAFDIEGYPARISFYRDPTFELAYTHFFDNAGRPMKRADRVGTSIASATLPTFGAQASWAQQLLSYDARTSQPVLEAITSPRPGGYEDASFARNLEFDMTQADGFGAGSSGPARYGFTRDAGGRVTSSTSYFSTSGVASPSVSFYSYGSEYGYRPDGRLSFVANADGSHAVWQMGAGSATITAGHHDFTYDSRGLLATQVDFDGTYSYVYDELGRNTRLTFPDGHARVQVFDDLGRITSRCYEYADPALTRCYGASYDGVGNPVELHDPEGVDSLQYDALDRLTKVTRTVGGIVVAVEDYAYNALGALSVHAGVGVDHQRPRLDGGGAADAALPNTLDAQAVALDPAGRVTALRGVDFGWSLNGNLTSIDGTLIGSDAFMRRVWVGDEFYVNEGASRIARVAHVDGGMPPGEIRETFLYDAIDHPLRLATGHLELLAAEGQPSVLEQTCVFAAYYEVDLSGNVRRLRGDGGTDLGGYRYSAFGKTLEDTVLNDLVPGTGYSRAAQPLRWKGRPRIAGTGAGELYDMRARFWSPDLGAFLSIDEYAFHDANTTLWGWPNQNPFRWSDPSGRSGFFTWGAWGGGLAGPVRPGGEGIAIGGWDSDAAGHGFYTAGVLAGGVEAGGEANYAGAFYGVERSSDGHVTPIALAEVNAGLEIPAIVGASDTLGVFWTDESFGWYWGPKVAALGEHASVGFGVSISKSWLPSWLRGDCPPER